MTVISKNIDFFFIKFPFIFPIIYFLILNIFPEYEKSLIILTIFLLAEPHFSATWPLFLHTKNKEHIKKNYIDFVVAPFILILFCLFGFFFFKNFFLLTFYMYNIYHVTRQSYGIMNLYMPDKQKVATYSYILYFFNIIFFLVGVFRFYFDVNFINNNIFLLNLIILLIYCVIIIFLSLRFGLKEDIFILTTGIFIFYPICFVSNPVHSILMGVTMHYTQYIACTFKVYFKRENYFELYKLRLKDFINSYFFKLAIVYSSIMTIASYFGGSESEYLKDLIIIAITFQMLHFYLDSRLWKFSEKHNRDNVLKHLIS